MQAQKKASRKSTDRSSEISGRGFWIVSKHYQRRFEQSYTLGIIVICLILRVTKHSVFCEKVSLEILPFRFEQALHYHCVIKVYPPSLSTTSTCTLKNHSDRFTIIYKNASCSFHWRNKERRNMNTWDTLVCFSFPLGVYQCLSLESFCERESGEAGVWLGNLRKRSVRFVGRLTQRMCFWSFQGQRTVYRLTLVKSWNSEELQNYADLVSIGKPDFIEVKVE